MENIATLNSFLWEYVLIRYNISHVCQKYINEAKTAATSLSLNQKGNEVHGANPTCSKIRLYEPPSESLNKKLSQDRATAVVNYLKAKGVVAERLSAKGYGSSQPIANNASSEGRQENRRTEFKIIANQNSNSSGSN